MRYPSQKTASIGREDTRFDSERLGPLVSKVPGVFQAGLQINLVRGRQVLVAVLGVGVVVGADDGV